MTNAERCQRDYQFYKKRGICINCHNENAMIGAVRCPECADKQAARDAERYTKLKADPDYRPRVSAYRKELRQRRRDAGLCHECGKRPVAEGYARCSECLIARRRKKDKRYDIPRSERMSYRLCYICGDVGFNDYNLCKKHYTQYVGKFTDIRVKGGESHPWARDNEVAFGLRG